MKTQYEHYFHVTPVINNIYIVAFAISLSLILFLRFAYNKRYLLNIYRPNVYLFEYESQKKYFLSPYSTLNFILKYFSLILIILSFYSFRKNYDILSEILQIGIAILLYFLYIMLIDPLFLVMLKKIKLYKNLIFVTNSFDNYLSFYFIILSFFIFYFPYKNNITLIISSVIVILFYFFSLLNLFTLINKHINLKKSQIFLYLCTSKILPILVLIYWLIFYTL